MNKAMLVPFRVLTEMEEPTIVFNVDPIGKPRMTQKDKWAKRAAVERYWAYKDHLKVVANAVGFEMPMCNFWMVCYIPVTPSWSKKKKEKHIGTPHLLKPDFDNILKGVLDALCKNDSHIWDGRVTKIWCAENDGRIEIYLP